MPKTKEESHAKQCCSQRRLVDARVREFLGSDGPDVT
jgi:hypothetical protein